MVSIPDDSPNRKGRKPRPAPQTPDLPLIGDGKAPPAKKSRSDQARWREIKEQSRRARSRDIHKALRADPTRTDKEIAKQHGTRAPEVLRIRQKLEQKGDIPRLTSTGTRRALDNAPTTQPARDRVDNEVPPASPPGGDPATTAGEATEPAEPPAEGEKPVDPTMFSPSGYTTLFGGTCKADLARDKDTGRLVVTKTLRLANFAARIVGETVTDDGAEQTREFAVEVRRAGRPDVTVAVPVERYGSLDWVLERLGPGYVIRAGNGTRDHMRAAIQEFTDDDVPSTTVRAFTGWLDRGGRWCYLHAGGAIGAPPGAVTVRLDGAAAGYHLPEPPTGDDLRAAVGGSLGLLDGLAPDGIVFPLLATVYRAVLGTSDFALWLAGLTGAQKSELAALAQQHFGPGMSRGQLPGNWSSTDNALEGLAFVVKDGLMVVDDFAPPVARADADRMHRVAERLIRGAGNSAGRQRMRHDGTLRPPKPPRGLILGTGEDVPRGHSIAARLCVVTVPKGKVDLTRLSACQRDAAGGRYAAALAGFVSWLAPMYGEVRAGLAEERAELRNLFVGRFPHARTPDVVANLLLGLRWLLRFAEQTGAVTAPGREDLWRRGTAAFLAAAAEQTEHQRAADPIAQFPGLLASVVSSGRGHVAGADGKEPGIPPSPAAWGWEEREAGGGYHARTTYHPRGEKLGWVVGDTLMLDPNAAYAAVFGLAQKQGLTFPVSQQALWTRLKEAGRLVRYDGQRTTCQATLEGARRRCVHLRVGDIFPVATAPEPAAAPVGCTSYTGPAGQLVQENALNPLGKPAFAPVEPVAPVSTGGEGVRGADAGDGYDEVPL